MPNTFISAGLATAAAGALASLVSLAALAVSGAGLLLIAFGLGVTKGRRDARTEERLELDRLFAESQRHGRLASFLAVPDAAVREMAAARLEQMRAAGIGACGEPPPLPDDDFEALERLEALDGLDPDAPAGEPT